MLLDIPKQSYMVGTLNYKIRPRKIVYSMIYVYYFSLALFVVTPYYYVINPLSIIVSVVCLIQFIYLPRKRHKNFNLLYLSQFIIFFISLFFIEHLEDGFYGYISLFKNVITAILPALFIIDTSKLKKVLVSFIAGGLINIILNLLTGLNSLVSGIRNNSDDILSLNSLGHATLIYLLCIILLYNFFKLKFQKYILLFVGLLVIVSMIITGSRQTFIAFMAFIVTFQFLSLRKVTIKKAFALISLTMIAGLGVYLIYSYFPYSPLVRRFTEESSDDSRSILYYESWKLFLQNPFSGYGIGTFKYYSQFVYTHSTYTELLFSGGIFVTVLFLLYYYKFLKITYRLIKRFDRLTEQRVYIIIFSITIAILVNGAFYIIHSSRLALSFQFLLTNYVVSKYFLKNSL